MFVNLLESGKNTREKSGGTIVSSGVDEYQNRAR
jgi:hypothetical protein